MDHFRHQINQSLTICLLLIILNQPSIAQERVRIWEEPLILPTYVVKSPDKNPMFFTHDSYQGASRHIYPYKLQDNISDEKIDQSYQALYLENEYIKLCVLPEIGGRLFYATDKTNGYEIFYRQNVIKPANIGMLGAWISGGVEFCVFHHHRASTNIPVDYRLSENTDGSATIWIGETEPRHRMKWTLGISLFPGKSYIEVDGRLINPTGQTNSILYWANVATHVNDDYQIIFPPSTDFAVYHAKNSFTTWPMTSTVYNGKKHYEGGVDASWWKNHPDPISMFAHDLKEGFLAGYDHGLNAGTMHVANHHIVKGAKLWEWGPGAYGSMWDSKVLTDSDGPYAELMTGAYSDNQPDYSWIKPYEYKTFKQYWYPLRNTGGAVAANLNATLNLKPLERNTFLLGINTTARYEDTRIKINQGKELLFETKMDVAPDVPFSQEITLPSMDANKITCTIYDSSGEVLLEYIPPVKDESIPLPDPVVAPKSPEEIESIEDLYFTGLRIKQFHNARIDAQEYFREALQRDPIDTRSNRMMGLHALDNFDYERAADYFRKSLQRATANYTRPRNCESLYHLGIALQKLGEQDAAYDTLYRAAWDHHFASAAYFHLAQISVSRNNYRQALRELELSESYNASNLSTKNLKTSCLRLLGEKKKAQELADHVLAKDPLNGYALNELVHLGTKDIKSLSTLLRGDPESFLEIAIAYHNAALFNDAKQLLLAAASLEESTAKYPTVQYYLGFLSDQLDEPTRAKAHFDEAASLATDYCFPFRSETIRILKLALEYNQSDGQAYYYLGNIYFEKQPEKAIHYWQKAVEKKPDLSIAHRNLGWAYARSEKNIAKAIDAYETAIRYHANDPKYFFELDKLYEQNGTSIEKRYQLLTGHHETVSQRPDAFLQEIQVLLLREESQQAIHYLQQHFFPRQEGVDNLHDIYVDACLVEGINHLRREDHQKALRFFRLADEYPENHQIARNPNEERNTQIYYYQGLAQEDAGRKEAATKLYQKVVALEVRDPLAMVYQALAFQKIGNRSRSFILADELEEIGTALLNYEEEVDFFSKFGESKSKHVKQSNANHLLAMVNLLRDEKDQARLRLEKAKALNPGNLWAHIHWLDL